MYPTSYPRRPWRGSVACRWIPDGMQRPDRSPDWRGMGNEDVVIKTARTKQRRLDRFLSDPTSPEWEA